MNEESYESHWTENLEYHIHPKRRPLEELDLIDAQFAKENKEKYYGQEMLTHLGQVSTLEDNEQNLNMRKISVDTCRLKYQHFWTKGKSE